MTRNIITFANVLLILRAILKPSFENNELSILLTHKQKIALNFEAYFDLIQRRKAVDP